MEFVQGGQPETQNAAVEFINTAKGERNSSIINCTFSECGSYCLKATQSSNVTVVSNIFYVSRKYTVKVDASVNFNFTKNLMIGVLPRPSIMAASRTETTACFLFSTTPSFARDKVVVEDNICQGSSGNGFIFPYVPCSYAGNNTRFINNEAGSCKVGFLLSWPNSGQSGCASFSKLTAYSCDLGLMGNPANTNVLNYSQLTLADNGRALGLKHGFGTLNHDNNTGLLANSWISALARPSCTYCYGDLATDCIDNEGVRMMVSTVDGQWITPADFNYDTNFDRIVKPAALDSKAFLTNVTFDNFRRTYAGLSACGNNVVFKPHPQSYEETGSHHLNNTSCNSCEATAYGYFTAPPALNTESMGCGNFACTGLNNYIIQDHSGQFLGFNGTILANNSWIGEGEASCVASPLMNGYVCNSTDFGVLEYESVAKDYNTRIVWPIQLSYQNGNWTSKTNGWKEWEWNGTEPKNRRVGRFVSTVVLGQIYNMSFASQPPSDMRFQLQKINKTGDASQWISVYIYYPIANYIAVSVNKQVIQPILASSNETVENRSGVCGANKYFSDNSTISFVVTGGDCQVRLSVTNNIQVSARIQTTVQEFFNKGGVTKFVDRMCAFLNITTDRLKVVGVFSGSIVVNFVVVENTLILSDTNNADTTNTTINPDSSKQDLTAIAKLISENATNLDLGDIGSVISTSTVVNIVNADGTAYSPPVIVMPDEVASTAILLAIIFSALIGAVLIAVGIFFLIRKIKMMKAQVKVSELNEKDLDESSVQKDKDLIFAEIMPNMSQDRIEIHD